MCISGDSRHGLYNSAKKDLYERGRHVAQCTKAQAVGIIVFVLTAIFLISLVAAFFRPFSRKLIGVYMISALTELPLTFHSQDAIPPGR